MMSFARQAAGANRWGLSIAGLFVLLMSLSGCSRNDELMPGTTLPARPSRVVSGRPVDGRILTVGISLPAESEYYRAVKSGMEAAAADNQVALEIRSAPLPYEQSQQVAELINRKVNALVVWCPDPDTARVAVTHANASAAPVFTVGAESDQGRVTAHFVPAVLMAGAVMKIAPARIGKTLVNRIARYLRGEKLKPYIVISGEQKRAFPKKQEKQTSMGKKPSQQKSEKRITPHSAARSHLPALRTGARRAEPARWRRP